MRSLLVCLLLSCIPAPGLDGDGVNNRADFSIDSVPTGYDLWLVAAVKYGTQSFSYPRFFVDSGNNFGFYAYTPGDFPAVLWTNSTYQYCSDHALSAGQTHVLVGLIPSDNNRANVRIWVDGTECSTYNGAGTGSRSASGTILNIADRSTGGRALVGGIRHVAYWVGGTLTAGDIARISNAIAGNMKQAIFSVSNGAPDFYKELWNAEGGTEVGGPTYDETFTRVTR